MVSVRCSGFGSCSVHHVFSVPFFVCTKRLKVGVRFPLVVFRWAEVAKEGVKKVKGLHSYKGDRVEALKGLVGRDAGEPPASA